MNSLCEIYFFFNGTESFSYLLQAEKGVPALLIYKKGVMVGNFVRMSDEFGEDFFAPEIESFLQE